jgi:streptomycin 6-kinase
VAKWTSEFPREWAGLGRPFPEALLELAVSYLTDMEDCHDAFLVNVDLHYDNILAAAREPWLTIDPKVVNGCIEYGIAPLLWNLYRRKDAPPLLECFDSLVALTASDFELARRWTVVRLVDYWLWALETGLTEDPKMCKELIDDLTAEG